MSITDKEKDYYIIPVYYFKSPQCELSWLKVKFTLFDEEDSCLYVQVNESLLLEREYCKLQLIRDTLGILQESNVNQEKLVKALEDYIRRSGQAVSSEEFETIGSLVGLMVGTFGALLGSTLVFSVVPLQIFLTLSVTTLLGITLGTATLGVLLGPLIGTVISIWMANAINYFKVTQPEKKLQALLDVAKKSVDQCNHISPEIIHPSGESAPFLETKAKAGTNGGSLFFLSASIQSKKNIERIGAATLSLRSSI